MMFCRCILLWIYWSTVDPQGAACCSGDGDEILKFCPSFHIVHLISQVHGGRVGGGFYGNLILTMIGIYCIYWLVFYRIFKLFEKKTSHGFLNFTLKKSTVGSEPSGCLYRSSPKYIQTEKAHGDRCYSGRYQGNDNEAAKARFYGML